MESEPRVHVVDDDGAMRESLVQLLRSVRLTARTYSSGEEFLSCTGADTPGCAVLDVRLPGIGGLELQQTLQSQGYLMPIIFLTGYADVAMAVRALQAGAFSFLEKPFRHQDFLDLVRRALEVEQELREAASAREAFAARLDALTPREREVLDMVVDGKTTAAIAYELGISAKTVEGHRGGISRKLNARSLAELVRMTETFRRGVDLPFRMKPSFPQPTQHASNALAAS